MNDSSYHRYPWFLLVLWSVVAIAMASSYPLASSSEAREAHIIADIVRSGQWLFPTRLGIIPSKPPLFHWVAALVGVLAGSVAPWVGRLISIFSGVLLVAATMRLAQILTSDWWQDREDRCRSRCDWTVVHLTGLIVCASHLFVDLSVNVRVDMLFAALSTLSLTILLPYTKDRRVWRDRGVWAEGAFWGVLGLGVLTKGPLAIVLPSVVVFIALWLRLGARIALRWVLPPSLTSLLAVVVPLWWYALASRHWGAPFYERHLFFENVHRITGATAHMNTEPRWFYIPSFVRTMFPWSILFLIAVTRRGYSPRGLAILIGWVASGLLLFSVASGKRHSYLLPLLPGVAIVAAHYLAWELRGLSADSRSHLRRWVTRVEGWFVLLPLLLPMSVFLWTLSKWAEPWPLLKDLLKVWITHSGLVIVVVVGLTGMVVRACCDTFSRSMVVWGVLPLIVIASGLGIKNTLKDFPGRTAQLLDYVKTHPMSSQGGDQRTGAPQVVVIKHRFEEYLDPFLYYASVYHASVPFEVRSIPALSEVPRGQWIVTMPNVVEVWQQQGGTPLDYQLFLEPTHQSGYSKPRADRAMALVRF